MSEEKLKQLEKRIELLENWLVGLAGRCWEACGTGFAVELDLKIAKLRDARAEEPEE